MPHRYRFFYVFCTFLILNVPVWSQDQQTLTSGAEAEEIVSDREKVDLIGDSNVAEAIDRRPDLQFENVTIDGQKLTVSLNDLQADQVESASVARAATPDLDADIRGGGLNLRSKPTYELEKRVIKGSIETEFNELQDDLNKSVSLSYGQSLGRWGFIFTASYNDENEAEEDYRQDWARFPDTDEGIAVLEDQSIRYNGESETELNFNGTVDFKLSDQVRLFFKGEFTDAENTRYLPRQVIRYDGGDYREFSDTGATVDDALVERNLTGWEGDSTQYIFSTGGYLDFEQISVDYNVSYSTVDYTEPEFQRTRFKLESVDLEYELKDKYGPTFQTQESSTINLEDPSVYTFNWIGQGVYTESQDSLLITLNGKIPVRFWNFEGHFKAGGKFQSAEDLEKLDVTVYDQFDGTLTLQDVVGNYSNPDILDGRYSHGPFPSYEKSKQFLSGNLDRFTVNETRSREESDPPTYEVNRDILAGFGMFFLKTGQLKMIAGVRAEQTDLDYKANELILDDDGNYVETNVITDDNSYSNFFPGLHGRYDLGAFSFIGSWSNTIARPNSSLIVPFREIDRESMRIEEGNPALNPTLFTNFDLSVDYHFGKSNLLTMELFYQTVEDIVYNETTIIEGGVYDGFELEKYQNGPSADIYGMRLIWSQDLGQWFEIAEGFSFNAVYTHQVSETEYPGRPGVTLPVPERPENEIEVSISYERNRFYAQFEIDYREGSLDEINDSEPWKDENRAGRTRFDFLGSYEITDGMRITMEINNLTNEFYGESYYGDEDLLTRYEFRPRTYLLGLRFDI